MDASYATALSGLDEAGRAEFWASLALRHTRNLGARSIRRLLGHFGSALAAVQGVRTWDAAGVRADRSTGLSDNSWRTGAQPEWNAAKALVGRILLWTDPDYPERLRELTDAPVLLYVRGRVELLHGPCLAVVGKRQCSTEGLRAATYFAASLAEAGVTIVSGLALGVDQAAHKAALGKSGGTLAVLGTGLDRPYPRSALSLYAQLADTGLLVSEFAPGTTADPGNFPIRNRIISGLSLGVLVVEAAPRSGSLITARLALEQNRSVYAVPGALGAPTARGCQDLIRQGASPVFAASDILTDLLPHLRESLRECLPESVPASLPASVPADIPKGQHEEQTADQARPPQAGHLPRPDSPEGHLLAVLHDLATHGNGVALDTLDEALDLPPATLTALLVRLEVQGLIRRLPGQYFMPAAEQDHG